MDDRIKVKINKTTLSKLAKIVAKRRPYYTTKFEVITEIDITPPTYYSLIKTGQCRSDVLDKINKYLDNN